MSSRDPEQLDLQEALRLLSRFPAQHRIVLEDGRSIGHLSSYRGYYEQLALVPVTTDDPCTVAHLVRLLDEAWGATFTGYKGGDYSMHGRTSLWVSPWGEASGQMLTRILARVGTDLVVLKTDQEVW